MPNTSNNTNDAADPATHADGNDSDDSSSSISTAPSVQHDPESEEGLLALHRIREAFFMAPSTPFAEVRAFFEGNANVVRHLARLTVPHPDHYLPDERTSRVHEPILQSDRALAAVRILFDVKAVDWQSEGMATLLDLVFREDREHLFYYTELLRKHRTGKRTKRAREWLRRHDRRFRELDNLQTARRRMERARGRRRSSLHNEMHYSSSSSDSSGGAPL
ncbi:hypothetical protein PWT90_01946 [Aphanocladium album]|nr:hypothetical protein PWT90_01946 [Aphanocladium album]